MNIPFSCRNVLRLTKKIENHTFVNWAMHRLCGDTSGKSINRKDKDPFCKVVRYP